MGTIVFSLFVGAAAGALLVALNTNKTDTKLQRQAKMLARSTNRGRSAVAEDAEGLMDEWKDHTIHEAGDLKRSMNVSINDLPG